MSPLPEPTWHRGMYGCPQDMYTAEQMRQHEAAVRAGVDERIQVLRLVPVTASPGSDSIVSPWLPGAATYQLGYNTACVDASRIARGGAA